MVAADPVLRAAVAAETRVGRRIAAYGREVAVIIIALLLPLLSFDWGVLYYEAILLLFFLSGRFRERFARTGRSWAEVAMILFDIVLLTFIAAVPNPMDLGRVPTAYGFRWNTFDYLFLVLAFATLAYSWRTVFTIGVTVAVVWLAAAGIVAAFGARIPELAEAASATARAIGAPDLVPFLDLNRVQWNLRVQEVVIFLIVAAALTLKGWRSNQLLFRQARAAAERANLSRYFAPTMVERLAQRPAALGQPHSQDVAVLFADLVGFTALAESEPEGEILALLRRYYAALEDAVFANHGTLDKYLGDGVMATFGTPETSPADAANALRAALSIVEAVDGIGMGLRVSVGVHFGRVTLGDVGPPRRLEFAVIGDTVNVAARLEAATRDLGARIVVSEALATRALVDGRANGALDGFHEVSNLALRGRSSGVDVRVWRG